MDDCLFCKIARKEIPSSIVYEDSDVLAFLDIKPVHPGHTLVIPKVHSDDFSQMDPVDREAVYAAAQKVTRALFHLGYAGVNVNTNVKPAAGQVVLHTHVHVIPRKEGDGMPHWPQQPYAAGQEKVWQDKLKKALQ